jgi:aquaporin Z
VLQRIKEHWPEYLIEAWALGMFMVSAGVCTVLLNHPLSPVTQWLPAVGTRQAFLGLAMGLTAIAIIYSRWGKRSGAHMNPAVTLSFLLLGKVHRVDAVAFIAAQFAGGLLGVMLVRSAMGELFSAPPIEYVVTRPGVDGLWLAFCAETVISFLLMSAVLAFSSRTRLAPYTGIAAGALVATFIAVEAPLSGMSMNPARSLASALPAHAWQGLWIYFVAPPAGMLLAAGLAAWRKRPISCAKLRHTTDVRCIHCNYTPNGMAAVAAPPEAHVES